MVNKKYNFLDDHQELLNNLKNKSVKEYLDYLTSFFNAPKQLKLLGDNPQLIQAYEEVLDVAELDLSDEA